MSTRRQRAASRANAQKSTGPTSPEGKAKSRFNALKHGIDAKQQVMFSESADDLAELAAEYHELHSPVNADERFLVDSMINYEWRLRRLRCVEASLWKPATNMTDSGPAFDRLNRTVNSCERHFHRARKELQLAQASRAGCDTDAETAPQPEETTAASASPASFRTPPEATVTEPTPQPSPGQSIPAAAVFQSASSPS